MLNNHLQFLGFLAFLSITLSLKRRVLKEILPPRLVSRTEGLEKPHTLLCMLYRASWTYRYLSSSSLIPWPAFQVWMLLELVKFKVNLFWVTLLFCLGVTVTIFLGEPMHLLKWQLNIGIIIIQFSPLPKPYTAEVPPPVFRNFPVESW